MNKIAFSTWNGKVVDTRKGKVSKASKSADIKYPHLKGAEKFKALMGWDGLVVIDEEADILSLTLNYLKEIRKLSCGECSVCMIGIDKLLDIMGRMGRGDGSKTDLSEMQKIIDGVLENSKCSFGQTSLYPVLDVLKHYKADFQDLVKGEKKLEEKECGVAVTAPCMEACPASLDIPGYIELIKNNKFDESLDLIRQNCILPGVTGRVCHHPCQDACVRNYIDESLSIRLLKRAASDNDLQKGGSALSTNINGSKKNVAIIGAGPAGLAAAYNLRLLGYGATIFEALPSGGGMAYVGIPDYRLPSDILNHEIDLIKRTGVEIKYNTRIDKLDMEEFRKKGFDAVFVAVGAHKGNKMGVEGEDQTCVGFVDGVKFLRDLNLGKVVEPRDKVIIVGGGNVALDCARSCKRLGFKEVEILYRRSREEMPARDEEIKGAVDEGIKIMYLTAPIEIHVEGDQFQCVKCIKMKLGKADESGRKRPEPVKGSDFMHDADMVICAIGQSPELPVISISEGKKVEVTPWGTIKVDQVTYMTGDDGIFAGGDCVTGAATLIEALDAGNKVARSIDAYLQDGSVKSCISFEGVELTKVRGKSFVVKGQAKQVDLLDPEERVSNFKEVEKGFTASDAMKEAQRCLRCYRVAVWEKA